MRVLGVSFLEVVFMSFSGNIVGARCVSLVIVVCGRWSRFVI